jgi:hypothetical protein
MNGWSIHPPRTSKEERRELAVADQAARRHKKNKAARKARRTNRK